MAETIQLDVSLELQRAISQAENLRKILNQSVQPDSSAYREIDNMLSKVTKQAETFKQSMGEALKTSSGTKTFTNNIQKTFDLLSTAATRLSAVRGKNLIFEDSDVQKIQNVEAQIARVQENIKELKKGKINGFFDDSTITEFKQVQDLAQKLGIDLKTTTFNDLQKAISLALNKANLSIDESTEKIKQLDNVLQNTNINDINKLTQGLNSQMAGNTIEVFKADNLTEANRRLQNFYEGFEKYFGKIKSTIKEGNPVSAVLENESKEINSVLSERLASLKSQQDKLQQAYNALQTITIGKGQKKNEKLNIIEAQQSVLDEIGFAKITDTQNADSYAKQARQAITAALDKIKLEEQDFEQIRISMLDGIQFVFAGLDTDKIIGNAKGLKQSFTQWLSGEGVDVKDNAIVQAFDAIKNKADVSTVINTIVTALEQYINKTKEVRAEQEQSQAEQRTYVASLAQSNDTVNQAVATQENAINVAQLSMEQLRTVIEQIIATREKEQATLGGQKKSLDDNTNAYQNLIEELKRYNAELIKSEERTKTLGNIRTAIINWMGFNQVMQLTKRAVSEAINHIKQLDTTMNGIAIVTDMTTADLWKQVDAYSDMAQTFGVTIQGAYEVSKIYYQAGYETNEVLTLTNETLKLAKISGLDYATTTDYMMTAMRGFKLEMEDASRVVDVYSNLAANTAVSQQELAEAMTRTASSMESVGATFEETSAMIATMVAVTRESANNIGSAMKSIASRYGELTKDPAALFDAEGEAMSFNKVDEALRSVGITLQTTDHQFRDFTDVILELADKWDTLDSAAQRYVATQFAGNRQQSRFLALVSNVDLLRQNIENAENSEDIGTLQTLKALDSLESKLNQVQVAYQQFYTTIGIENVWKALLDSTTNVINTLNGLPKLFDVVPINAAAMAYTVITLIKNIILSGFSALASQLLGRLKADGKQLAQTGYEIGKESGEATTQGYKEGTQHLGEDLGSKLKKNGASILSSLGSIGVMIGAIVDKSTEAGRSFAAWSTGLGGASQIASGVIQAMTGNWPAAIMSAASGVINIINGVSIGIETSAEKLERLTKEAENLNNEAKKAKAEYNTLNRSIDKINELDAKRNESIEATEDYHEAVNELADSFPQLIIGMDEAGNAIINTADAENILTDARQKAADATIKAAEKEYERAQEATTQIAQNTKETLAPFAQPGQTSEDYAYQGKIYKVDLNSDLDKLRNETNLISDWGIDIARAFNDWDGLISELESAEEVSADEIDQFKMAFREWVDGLPSIDIEEGNIFQSIQAVTSLSPEQLLNPEVQKQIFDLNKIINESNFKFNTEEEAEAWSNFISELKTLINTATVEANAQRKLVSQSLSQQNDELANSGLLNQLTTSLLIATKENPLDVKVKEQVTATQLLLTWWKGLGETQKVAENIFKNLSDYSLNDIYQLLDISEDKNYLTDFARDEATQMRAAISNYYYTQVQDYSESIQLQLEKSGLNIKSDIFESQLGLSVINNAANLIIDYEKRGLADNAEQLRAIAYNLFSELSLLSKEAPEQFVAVLKLLDQGFSTKEDIKNLQSRISELGLGDYGIWLINILDSLSSTIVTNYVSSLNTALNTNTDKYKNDIKTISKLSKGLSIDELYDFLTSSLNILQYEADKFTQDMSGAFKLSDTLMKEYWNAYIKENYEISDEIKSFTENIRVGRRGFVKTGKVTENLARLNLDPNATDEQIEQAIDDYLKLYDATQQQVDFLKKQITTELNASLGDYSEQIQQYGSIFVFANAKLDKDDIIGRETQKTLNDAYSSLISDVLSKGFKYINPEDYTGLIKGKPVTLTGISYQQFVQDYVDYTGKTVEEINDLILQAIEKDTAKTSGAAQDALKNVTFFREDIAYASIDTIKALADAFGKDIRKLYDSSTYNEALDAYQLILNAVDFSGITNSMQIVSDSVQEALESIANLISNGIKGTLSNEGRATLISNLDILGIDVKQLNFTQTAEGLRLSTESAIYLYSELKNIDSIRAHLVFDSLKDSLTEAGEACENITSTVSEIARLEKELRKPENENNQILNDRLALYKEIAREQALSDPSQFSFMNRNLSNGMQGPVNYWNDVSKAFKVMKEAKSSGYMDFEDYVNIVNEWARTAELSGEELVIGGQHFANSSKMADYLIQRGISAFTEIDGEGMKVSLAALGENAQIGVEDMSAGINAAVKQMAQSQMDMLDAQIKFLEGVVALQNLNSIAGDDGWQLSDIFEGNDFSSAYTAVLELENVSEALKGIEFNGTNLYEFLHNYDTMMKYFDGKQNKAYQFILELLKLANSEEWTNTNLEELFNNLAKEYNLEIQVDFDADTKQLEKDAQTAHDRMESIFAEHSDKRNKTPAYYSNSTNEISHTTETSDNKQVVDVQYSDSTPTGLKELIESTNTPLTRTITTENSMNVTNVITEDGIELVNGFYQVKTQSSTLEISASIGEVIGLEETIGENGEKGYKIILANGEGFSIPAAIDSENVTGIVPNEDGTSYTINLSNGNGFSIPAKINDQQVVGMDYDAKNGIVTLKTNNNQGFSIPVKIDNQQVTGMRYNETEKKYYIDLANGQFITILTSADDGYSTDILNWANSNTVEIKTKFKNIDELPDPTDSDKLKLKIYSGESLSDDELEYITKLAKTSEEWANILANANINLDNNNQATQEATEANNNNTESVENHTSAINESTEQTEKYSKNVSKATTDVQLSSKRFIKAGNDLIPIGNASLRVVTAEERLITVTNLLVKAIDTSANTINNTIKNMAGYSPMTSGTTLGNRMQTNKPVVAKATGNIALATGRSTLMGELGPELYVTNGHYYVAGQNGAEFVNLPDDAIVFNHLQTARLLAGGNTGRGKPVTNERKATSYAKGNIAGGPAKASAAAVLAELKRIRAEWKSLFDAGARDLGSLAGSGGGSGGGGGNDKWQQKTTTAEIQRWYNLIRQIAKLEEDISYQETLQSKIESDRIANGHALYKSYKQELDLLKQEITANEELSLLQRSWYDAKRAELAASDYGKIFTYNENGLQQYTGSGAPGSGLGLDILENLTRRDVYGQAVDNAATAQKQLEYLKSLNFNIENLKYNDDGTTIDLTDLKDEELDNAYVQMMENFWSNVDSWRDELDSIYDSYNEQLENVLSNQDKQNEIMQKIVDNQLDVEKEVLNAIEEREQKRIDDAQDERDALSDSADKFLNGLSDQLNKEREMYSRNENQDELNQLRRQLAILTRTGGSSSQIRSLQDQINSKSQEQYFNSQQDQIDAIKEASDAQIERLDEQINVMTETLAYQKENGLLWQEVYQVMAQTPEQIQDFIMNNTPDFQSNSALQVAEDLRELKLKIEQWVDYREDLANGNDITNRAKFDDFYNTQKPFYNNVDEAALSKARDTYNTVLGQTGDTNAAMQAAMNILEGYKKKPEPVTNSTGGASSGKVSGTGSSGGGGGSGSGGSGSSSGSAKTKTVAKPTIRWAYKDKNGEWVVASAHSDAETSFNMARATAMQFWANNPGMLAILQRATLKNPGRMLKQYAQGGLVDYTGLAMVHGSPQDPESFLDAEHTKLLKADMETREKLLPSLLNTYDNIIHNSTTGNINNNNNDGVVIESLQLNLQFEKLSNDYDVRRAVDVMKEELVNISRQSGNIGIKRR